jgi:hypothetical protein
MPNVPRQRLGGLETSSHGRHWKSPVAAVIGSFPVHGGVGTPRPAVKGLRNVQPASAPRVGG